MGRVRVFYGHEGVVPPTGLRSRSAAAPAPEAELSPEEEFDGIVGFDEEGNATEFIEAAEVEDAEVDEAAFAEAAAATDDADEADADEAEVEDADEDADAESDEDEAEDGDAESDEAEALPDDSWTKGDLLAFAEERGFDMTGATKTKPAALARVLEHLKEK